MNYENANLHRFCIDIMKVFKFNSNNKGDSFLNWKHIQQLHKEKQYQYSSNSTKLHKINHYLWSIMVSINCKIIVLLYYYVLKQIISRNKSNLKDFAICWLSSVTFSFWLVLKYMYVIYESLIKTYVEMVGIGAQWHLILESVWSRATFARFFQARWNK